MKTNRKNPFLIAAITLAGIAFTATSAVATPYFWDIDSDTAAGAGGSTPSGSWAALGATWSTDSTGAAATSAYTTLAADDLTFSAGTDATGSYTVTLGANQDANSLTFEEGAVTLAGNTITLAAGGITVAPGAGDAIIGSALIASGVRIYDVGTGRNLTLNGALGVPVSATSTITKNGAGTMTMGAAAHGIAGNHTVNEGLLITNHATNDLLKGNVVINSGGTMRWTGARWDNGSQFTINAGGTLNIQATSDLINRVNGAGTITGTGNTTVTTGTLQLADNAQLKFVIGATSGTNNRITGAGTVMIDGDFNIDTSLTDASTLTSGSWTIVDAATLTENFGASFTITGAGWSETSNIWTKTVGTKKYIFTEATGILTLGSTTSYASWIDGFFPNETDQAIIGANADPDNDGIANGVEMVIGGNPKLVMDTALLPTLELVTDPVSSPAIPVGNYLLFTYRRSDLSVTAGVTADCETDTDLTAAWTLAAGAPGVVIQVDDNFSFTPPAAADTDRVRVYVPRGANPLLFGRLKVLVP